MWREVLCSSLFLAGCATQETPTATETGEVKVCASGPVVEGIDVSYYQGTIDWTKVKAAGIGFAYIRVSDSLSFKDPKFAPNWAAARAAGVLRGTYQFFRENQDPIEQADLLLDMMGPLEADDLPAAIDVESVDGNATRIVANVSAWMDRVEAGSGKKPIIYTGRPFWDDNTHSSTAVNDHALWIPNWGPTCPSISSAWPTWHFWQYSATGSISGITGDVDRDQWNGDRASLLAFAGVTAQADAPTAPDAGTSTGSPDAGTAGEASLHMDGGCAVGGSGRVSLGTILAILLALRFPRRRARANIISR